MAIPCTFTDGVKTALIDAGFAVYDIGEHKMAFMIIWASCTKTIYEPSIEVSVVVEARHVQGLSASALIEHVKLEISKELHSVVLTIASI